MDLLESLFDDLSADEWIEVRVISRDRKSKQFFVQSVARVHEIVSRVGEQANVYFGVCPRSCKDGHKEAVKRCFVVWTDVDGKSFVGGKEEALTAVKAFALAPSFVVDSGNGFHVYWRLVVDTRPEDAEGLMKEIAAYVGGDCTWDISRLLRVPGSFNVKGDVPIPCRLERSRGDLKYNVADLSAVCSLDRSVAHRIETGSSEGYQSRSERDWAVTTALVGVGVSELGIRQVFAERSVGDKFSEEGGERYLSRTVGKARRRRADTAASALTERDDCYYVDTAKGVRQVSTFKIEPKRLLHGDDQDAIMGDIVANELVWEDKILPKSSFDTRNALQRYLTSVEWQWTGTDDHVRLLLPFLVSKLRALGDPMPSAKAVSVLGRHEDYWVAPHATFSSTAEFTQQDAPVLFMPPRRGDPLPVQYALPSKESFQEFLDALFPTLLEINNPETLWPILSWFMATPYKPLLRAAGVSFPTLNVYGTRGSGKTTTVTRVMQPLVGYMQPTALDCSTTQFVLLTQLSSTNAVPISLSEFRRSGMREGDHARLIRYVLLAYDSSFDARGRADQTVQEYHLLAPFTLDGEDAIADPAAQERSLIVNLKPETLRVGGACWKAYNKIAALPLNMFAGPYVQYTLTQSAESVASVWQQMFDLSKEAFPEAIPDRVQRNIATACLGMQSFKKFLAQYEIDTVDMDAAFIRAIFKPQLEDIIDLNTGRTRILVDEMVEDIINIVAASDVRVPFTYKYDKRKNILWVHLTTALNWWHRKRRAEGRASLDSAAVKRQLDERSMQFFIGPGQYIMTKKTVALVGARYWMHGIDISVAHNSGLDVPDSVAPDSIIVTYGRGEADGCADG